MFKKQPADSSLLLESVVAGCAFAVAAIDACAIVSEISMDAANDTVVGTMQKVVRGSVLFVGRWACAFSGARMGALAGERNSNVGWFAGGLVGGMVGVIGGSYLARKTVEAIAPAFSDGTKR